MPFRTVVLLGLIAAIPALTASCQPGGIQQKYLKQHENYADRFKSGDATVPFLAVDWFSRGAHFCRVDKSGTGHFRVDVGHSIRGGGNISLGTTNLQLLIDTISHLPPPPTRRLPLERQVVLSCIRSNQWFHGVYDRGDVPIAIEKLFEITGANLAWFVPPVEGRKIAGIPQQNFSGSFRCVGSDALVTVSIGYRVTNSATYFPPEMQVWDLREGFKPAGPAFALMPQVPAPWESVAMSPNGSTVVVAMFSGVYGVDWKTGKLLWQAPRLDHDNRVSTFLAVGDGGKTLFTAGAHTIERWDLAAGKKLAHLATSPHLVRLLKTARNGQVLVAGFGSNNSSPTSFAIWESASDRPARQFEQRDGATIGISPDGETLALSRWADRKFLFWRWRTDERIEVPIRNSEGAQSAYSMNWSPDGKRFAAYLDTYPASIFIYDAATWKPIAQWRCGEIGAHSEFSFQPYGTLLQLQDDAISALDAGVLKTITN